jgi:hypothetical protein
VTPTASIVIVEAAQVVEPQKPAEIGKLWVERSPEPLQELRLDRTGESRAAQRGQHLPIEVLFRPRRGSCHQRCNTSTGDKQVSDTLPT